MSGITEKQIDAAMKIFIEEYSLPYMARISDFINSPTDPPKGPRRDAALGALKEADKAADELNRDFIRRILIAANEA